MEESIGCRHLLPSKLLHPSKIKNNRSKRSEFIKMSSPVKRGLLRGRWSHTPAFMRVFSPVSVLSQRGSLGGRKCQSTSSSCGSGLFHVAGGHFARVGMGHLHMSPVLMGHPRRLCGEAGVPWEGGPGDRREGTGLKRNRDQRGLKTKQNTKPHIKK